MKRARAGILAVCLMGLMGTVRAETTDDIVSMANKGVGEEIILATVGRSRTSFNLSAQDIVKLKEQKVPDKVVMAMLRHKGAAPAAVAAEQAPEVRVAPKAAPVQTAGATGILNIENLDDRTWSYRFDPATRTIWISPASADGQGNVEPKGGLNLRMPAGSFDVVYNGQTAGQPVTVFGDDASLITLSRVQTKDLEALYVTVFERGERKASGKLATLRSGGGVERRRVEAGNDEPIRERIVERERVVEVPSTTYVYRDAPTVIYSGSYYPSYDYPRYYSSGYYAPRYYSGGYYGGHSHHGHYRGGSSANFGYSHVGRSSSFGIGIGVGRR